MNDILLKLLFFHSNNNDLQGPPKK